MKFFIDTANLKDIKSAQELGVIDGVTTNPTLIAQELKSASYADFKAHIRLICELVDGPVSAEVTSLLANEIIAEGEDLAQIHEHVVVKCPMTPDGIKAIKHFSQKGIKTNATLVFSATQALLAAKAGATMVSPFIGRIDDVSHIASAVQSSPVYFNTPATIEKACMLIKQAAYEGAELVAFPEVFVSAYPYWNWVMDPIQGSEWFEKLCQSSITISSPEVGVLCQVAKEYGCVVVIGINERAANSVATIYNTVLIINEKGELIGRHRKLVPTWAEKLTWAAGDGSSLKVYETKIGPLGVLACGENTNTLARFALLSQGELVHIANYISLPVAPVDYDMAEAIKIRAAAHSFEGKIFTIISCSTVSEEIISLYEKVVPNIRERMAKKSSAFSGFIGPNGQLIGEHLIDNEGIVYATIDLNKCIQPKQMHDIIGHYNRFDIFNLKVNIDAQESAVFYSKKEEEKLKEENQFVCN
ncbi:hypothetical protein CHS0354_000551 [Potamilus streckersoni]|uniref:CN hydrolase domain-containing protein n=1 Tax=Potamilus streckersoni TaxID=2493646 RepID=A0AAE0W7F2_9BIVA|nr:hypothetical protein CHS0354_000551 [Potamilus streckersoni]